MKWDRNDWQGKTEEQVKYSYYALLISGLLLVILPIISLILKFT